MIEDLERCIENYINKNMHALSAADNKLSDLIKEFKDYSDDRDKISVLEEMAREIYFTQANMEFVGKKIDEIVKALARRYLFDGKNHDVDVLSWLNQPR